MFFWNRKQQNDYEEPEKSQFEMIMEKLDKTNKLLTWIAFILSAAFIILLWVTIG